MFDPHGPLRVIVIGGYGLIGSAILRAARAAGHTVEGVGRSRKEGLRVAPDIPWHELDVAHASHMDWKRIFKGADVIINASGILQDGNGESTEAIHVHAIRAMTEALQGSDTWFIQISAVGASPDASTAFLRTKAEGDEILSASDLDWIILRPGLVLSPQAFGGTGLLRASAAFPCFEPRLFEKTLIQTVSVEDVAAAVVKIMRAEIPLRRTYDLVEDEARSLPEVMARIRAWQGHAARRLPVRAPSWALRLIGRAADALGHLGWRPALRTTAMRVLEDGVVADPGPWRAVNGVPCGSLDQTLARMPSTVQERWFANLYFLVPLGIGCLSLFWILSGIIGAWQHTAAMSLLTTRGVSPALAGLAVFGGAVADVALGAGILVRRTAKAACAGMIAVSLAYLVGGTLFAPDLWADPIGPLVKVLPSIVLTLFVRALLENR